MVELVMREERVTRQLVFACVEQILTIGVLTVKHFVIVILGERVINSIVHAVFRIMEKDVKVRN